MQEFAPLETLLKTTPLGDLPRTGWIQAGLGHVESVAAHSHGVCLLVLAMGTEVNRSREATGEDPLDIDRAVSLAAVHDLGEALLGDIPKSGSELLPPGAKATAERAAAEGLGAALSEVTLARWREFAAGESSEARLARICDKLQMGLKALALLRRGARGLDDFRSSIAAVDCAEFKACSTLKAQLLADWDGQR